MVNNIKNHALHQEPEELSEELEKVTEEVERCQKVAKKQIKGIFAEYIDQIHNQIVPLSQPYEVRYKAVLLDFNINAYSSVQSVCKYPFFYAEQQGIARCHRKLLDDVLATEISAVIFTHELIPVILPLLVGRSRFYLTDLEAQLTKLQISNHDSPSVPSLLSQIQKELNEVFSYQFSRDLLFLTSSRATEMENTLKVYQMKGAISFNRCDLCGK